jgi:inhibitor of cysteine peptidase
MVTTRIGPSSDGKVVTLVAGAVLELVLPENPTTGYRWVLDPPPTGSSLVDDRLELGDSSPAPGAAATHVFAVVVERTGTLHARLGREWESEPAQHFTVRVELG